ncbi:uncharacterized protein [Physcomitrium patens]|uniref:Essential protein Yae1 N-terminal domain-containing protein n=1 Tax=Physcomitrium patens TaxID=3218 RepID=A0A2K1KFZ8_PHYPA|nr:oral cancer-overexpressed protein 1 homolog [Physcomitrium patens]PNR52706.1 hypothetical protein PHYPA_009081 [Physcomitrium patens]|eukprot:XP_024379076.1 oral cancer-overexpressed protein 1 homolog [Physcomitrella patens]
MAGMPGLEIQRRGEEEDIFDSTVHLEGSHFEQGFQDGFRDGVELGKVEGREVGLKTGFELGEEIGFFRGCVNIWNAVLQKDPSAFSARAQRNIRVFDQQLNNYPLKDPQDERLQDSLDSLRSKFRLIMSLLSIQLDYQGLAKVDHTEDSLF